MFQPKLALGSVSLAAAAVPASVGVFATPSAARAGRRMESGVVVHDHGRRHGTYGGGFLYRTDDIQNGVWTKTASGRGFHDPSLFFDDANGGTSYIAEWRAAGPAQTFLR